MSLNPQSAELDAAILAIAKRLYGKTPRLQKCQSERNYCALLSFDDGTADRIIKIANRSGWAIEVERHLYPAMRMAGLPVPEIEFTHEDNSELTQAFIVMPKFSDYTLKEVCQNNHDVAMRAVRSGGQFIRSVSSLFEEEFMAFLDMREVGAYLAENQKQIDYELDLNLTRKHDPELAEIIEHHFSTMSKPSTKQLTHGQPHLRNILADENGNICAIDWGESIGMSSPLRDLHLLLNSHDGWSRGTGDPRQRAAILEGYGGIDGVGWKELHYWEFRFWVKALQDYMKFVEDPTKDANFVANQLRGIISKVREVSNGGGLIHRLEDDIAK